MLIEKRDWATKLRDSAGFKKWDDYCEAVGLKYTTFMSALKKERFTVKIVEKMSEFHGMNLDFLLSDDCRGICRRKIK